MILSIDFDDTWTQDPEAWRAFARLLASRGHTVIVTTNRYPLPALVQEVHRTVATSAVTDVIFAGATPKKVAAAKKGYRVDVWVDDRPEAVLWGRSHPRLERCECRGWARRGRDMQGHHPRCPIRSGLVVA